MNAMKKILLATALAAAFTAPSAWAADAAALEATLKNTETKLDAIVETGFVWRWTYDRIKDARQAIADGKLDEAEKITARAVRETELAYEQIETADKVWEITVPK